MQIYSEKVFDLLNLSNLNPKKDTKGLRLRWNKKDQFVVENLFIYECQTEEEVMDLFHFGIKNKVVASHNLNHASSRSHAIFTITCESVDPSNIDNVIVSKLQLVDLAGSERIALTGTKGIAAKESIDINKSLFVLRKVIMGLSDASRANAKDKSHIPYRDSKLTSLLKQSIGGNSYCLMIACIAPSDRFFEENLSTLNYATRASYIANAPTKNIDPKIKEIQELKIKNKLLQIELQNANKHIEFLTSLTSESLKTFGTTLISNQNAESGDLITEDISNSSGSNMLKIPQINSISQSPSVSKGTGTSTSSGTKTMFKTNSGLPAQTELSTLPKVNNKSKQKSVRAKSKDPLFETEQMITKQELQTKQEFNKKMSMISNEIAAIGFNKEGTSSRFTDAMTRVTDLLKVNQLLRDESSAKEEIIRKKNIELYETREESEELRDRIELLETIVQADSGTFDKYVSSNLFTEAQKSKMGEYMGIQEG